MFCEAAPRMQGNNTFAPKLWRGPHTFNAPVIMKGIPIDGGTFGDFNPRIILDCNKGSLSGGQATFPYYSAIGSAGSDYPFVGYNFKTGTSNGSYSRLSTDVASAIQFYSGGITFKSAANAAAGTGISWTDGLAQDSNGRVSIPVPNFGIAFIVNGLASSYTQQINGDTGTGTSLGLKVKAGTNASDFCVLFQNASAGSTFFQITGTGNVSIATGTFVTRGLSDLSTSGTGLTINTTRGVTVGSPTGGDKGNATLNATQLYVAGVALYTTGTFTGTFTGMTAGTTGTGTWVLLGKIVTLSFPTITGTSNTTAMTMTGLPAAIQSVAQNQLVACSLEDNSLNVAGAAQINTASGTITFFRGVVSGTALNYTASGFTNSGVKGMNQTTFSYTIQ